MSLIQHPKIESLAGFLGTSRSEAIGIAVQVWVWAYVNTEGGDISGKFIELASEIGYPNPSALEAALIRSGLVDRIENRGWLRHFIHDWADYAPAIDSAAEELERRRAKDAARQRRRRAKQSGAPLPPPPPSAFKPKPPPPPPSSFDAFWEAYPASRRRNRPGCQAKWAKAVTMAGGVEPIMAGLQRWKESEQWSNPRYIQRSEVWLNQANWDDHPEPRRGPPPESVSQIIGIFEGIV